MVMAGVASVLARRAAQQLSRSTAANLSIAALRAQAQPQAARSFSVFSNLRDTVTSKMEERNQVKQEEAYRQQMQDLAHSTSFDLDAFYSQLKKNADASGLSGWKSMIPGVSSMTAVQQLKLFMKIIDSIDTKRQIIEKSGHTAEEINSMLRQYEQLSALRLWLVKRVERGLSIPDTVDETTELVRLDPTGFPSKKFRVKRRY
ncbi:hypothetical protein PybrP1_005535 [[Pythium] brassicae (nom. inval.)]|nr:hypothetical protein PybrP1_005535 [[Pythium] brassicae (nom. inval.)]